MAELRESKLRLMGEILQEIKSVTKRREKPEKCFVCYDDLKQIWSDASRISLLLQPVTPSPDTIRLIQQKMIIVLSTLVSANAVTCFTNIPAILFDSETRRLRLTDEGIPYERDQLIFLNSEPALPSLFYDHQFRFKPEVIQITRRPIPLVIRNPKIRLPFEKVLKGVGIGGYGQVDCVSISPKCIRKENGSSWEIVHEVACKKIKLRQDYAQEVKNLQILKESLIRHENVMLHLATIEHGPNYYILLPYAEYGDLELFLHCGRGPDGQYKYAFNERFKGVENNDITSPLLRQCWSLTSALGWLHKGITIEKTSSTVLCVHMDLKPANILIMPDDESPVGKFMISDFGISVLTEDATGQGSEYASIGDYYSELTVNTRPKRREGTYQAPEIKLSEILFNQTSHLTPDQKGIGRRSDIWSFGCILSEVLAFSIGRDKLVYEFQAARKREGIDYFFVEKADQGHLQPPNIIKKQYEVNPQVLSWLNNLCNKNPTSNQWVDCFVETIKKILIVDATNRPDASGLSKLVNHLKEHVAAFQENTHINCFLSKAKDPTTFTSSTPKSQRALSFPTSTTSSRSSDYDMGENISQSFGHDRSGGRLSIGHDVRPLAIRSFTTSPSSSVPESAMSYNSSIVSSHRSYEPYALSEPDLRRDSKIENGLLNGPSSHGFEHDSKPLHSITTGLTLRGIPEKPVRVNLPRPESSNPKAAFVSLTHSTSGVRVAYLARSSVYIYRLNIQDLSASFEREIKIVHSDGWKGVHLAGHFLAAWGYSSKRTLHLCDINQPHKQLDITAPEIVMLEKVAVSEQGLAALLCGETILIVNIDSQIEIKSLRAQHKQKFADVAFNETGDLLFAWTFGPVDTLCVWECRDNIVNDQARFEIQYTVHDKRGKPNLTRIIPYSTQPFAIMSTPDKRFFHSTPFPSLPRQSSLPSSPPPLHSPSFTYPSQLSTSSSIFPPPTPHAPHPTSRQAQPRPQGIMRTNVKASHVFQDHSFVTLEKKSHFPRADEIQVREYEIVSETEGLTLTNAGNKICTMETGTEDGVAFAVISCGGQSGAAPAAPAAAPGNVEAVIVVCNLNETVEFVRLVR